MVASPTWFIIPKYSEVVLDANIYVSSTAAGTDKFNMLKPQPTDIWKSSGAGSHTIDIDLGATPPTVASTALLNTVINVGTSMTVTAGATQGASTFSSGALVLQPYFNDTNSTRRHLIYIPPSAQTYRWWRFSITDNIAAVSVGNLVLGDAWRPQVEYGLNWSGTSSSGITATDGGQLVSAAPWREIARNITMTLIANTEQEQEEKFFALSERQNKKPVLVIRDISDAFYTQQRVVWGLITDITPITLEKYGQWRVRVTVSGMI